MTQKITLMSDLYFFLMFYVLKLINNIFVQFNTRMPMLNKHKGLVKVYWCTMHLHKSELTQLNTTLIFLIPWSTG